MHEEQQLMIFLTLIAYNLDDRSMKSLRKTLIELSLIIILKQIMIDHSQSQVILCSNDVTATATPWIKLKGLSISKL